MSLGGVDLPEDLEGIADYRFVRSLGEGTLGAVWLAVPPERLSVDDDHVAVKVLGGPSHDAVAFRRLTKELRLFASIASPQLVRLLDAGQDRGRFFYSMRWYELGSLAAPSRPLEQAEVVKAVVDAARAAHALHEAGVAHRDIKPTNVLLDEGGGVLADLGLASVLTPGQTVTGMGAIGSLEYMDPGTISGARSSRASDVWALGVTLHRALTGASVWDGLPADDPLLAIRHVLSRRPVVHEGLDAELAGVIGACLAADESARPPTAEALATMLEGVLEPTPDRA